MPSSSGRAESVPATTAVDRGGIKKIVKIGICAMNRKATSKPMRAIMAKMLEFYKDWLEFLIFEESVIISEPVENWPMCDCLIGFHSTDFPLKKAMEYERLRRPYVINDLNRQFDILDRRKVFRTLARSGIDHPRHCVVIRDEQGHVMNGEVKEFNDHIEIDGMVFNKPFVEKPISAEDHNIYIYYPSSVGGGSQRLFRKVNDRSSWYSTTSSLRTESSYIYEEFIPADGTDVKVYAVGPYYAHAEARKAPGLDGKVERDADGKEVRYPVILSAREKMIARRVVLAFGQTVCGFDLLRANGRSYVCDVNGFSFVKTSQRYYEDTAKILGNMILRRLASSLSIPWHIPFQDDDPPLVSTPSGKIMELRCVLAIIRHGDRTPKQKMKIVVDDDRFLALFHKHGGAKVKKEIKMKRPNQLMEVLELTKQILHEQQAIPLSILAPNLRIHFMPGPLIKKLKSDYMKELSEARIAQLDTEKFKQLERRLEKCEDSVKTWDQMRTVLEMYGHFSGINRKVQLKYLKPKDQDKSIAHGRSPSSGSAPNPAPPSAPNDSAKPKLLLILKWGGELTTAGVLQAEALGKLFRTLYPGIKRADGKDCPEDTQGLGFLRLHSTYRHDLKIYASDEGRVQMTAAAFARGLLALEGELTPILMQMVKSANTDGLLNDDYMARQFQDELKGYLHSVLQADRDFTTDDYRSLNPSGLRSILNAMEFIRNPKKMCNEIAGYVQKMCDIIRYHMLNNRAERSKTLYLNETWELAARRWSKELREFRKISKSGDGSVEYDISKIPDIYDNIKYGECDDMEHNPDLCINNEGEFERFYLCVKNMADIVVPQEYGVTEDQKMCVAQRVCTPLVSKIRNDLHRCIESPDEGSESLTRLDPRASEGIATPMRHVRTRLYFTSESHIHTLMNLIRYGGLCPPDDKKWQRAMNFLSGVTEFNYMTQVVMMVYEDSGQVEGEADEQEEKKDATGRFHIELLFSPGLYPCFQTEKERIYENRFNNKHRSHQHHPNGGASANQKGGPHSKAKTPSGTRSNNLSASDTSDRESNNEQSDDMGARDASSKAPGINAGSSATSSIADKLSRQGSLIRASRSINNEEEQQDVTPLVDASDASAFRERVGTNKSQTGRKSQSEEAEKVNGGRGDDGSASRESDDELTDHSVNLVVLGEVGARHHHRQKYTSSELAKHSPPTVRKRHPTYEKSHSTQVGSIDEEPTHDGGVSEANEKKAIKPDEFVKIVHKTAQQDGSKGPPPATPLSEAVTTTVTHQTTTVTHSTHSGHSAPLVKSMSETGYNMRMRITYDINSPPIEDGDGAADGVADGGGETENRVSAEKPTFQLELDENQATVGHEKGEWIRNLAKDGKKGGKTSNGSSNAAGDQASSDASSTTSGTRTATLASIFLRSGEQSDAKASVKNDDGDNTLAAAEVNDSATSAFTLTPSTKGSLADDTSTITIKDLDATGASPNETPSSKSRRSRFPYRFKHHTVNLLAKGNGVENKLISTDVLMGKFTDAARKRTTSNSVVLSTAIIGRSSSAPRLQVYKAEDDILVTDIRRFWPPLRSLETMHDNIGFNELDRFLERMMKASSPLPSPPKTPILHNASVSSIEQHMNANETAQKLETMKTQ